MKFDDATVERVACALAITLRRMNFDATLARKALDALTPEDLVRALRGCELGTRRDGLLRAAEICEPSQRDYDCACVAMIRAEAAK